jgi:hypothetical protein
MASRNPWANWSAPKTGATQRRNQQNRRNNQQQGYRKPSGNGGYMSWWRPPPPPDSPNAYPVNAIQRSLMRLGGNSVTNQFADQGAPSGPGGGNSGGGGGWGGGGGGGGGGGVPAVNQAMIDALAQALGVQGQQLTYQDLPKFQGQALGAFNPAPYNTQRGLVDQAVNADMANFAANQAATTKAVQGAYTNPYATAQVQQGPATPQIGAGLMATAGATVDPAMAQQMNAENAQNQGSFQDLLSVLSANSQQSQESRMAQVGMDANYGRQQANAQALGLRGGIANAQAQAANAWQQQAAERAYQNSLMQQQWAMQNAQGRQGVNQANWQQQNANLTARLQPILDLISKTAGIKGLNMAPLMAALRGAGGMPA